MLNTGQLALICRPIAGEEFRVVNRQMQHWVSTHVVPPNGPPNPGHGKGRERRYGPESALLAAIATSLGRWKIPAPILKLTIGALIQREVKADPKWHGQSGRLAQVIAGKDLLLVLQHTPNDSPKGIEYFFVRRADMSKFMASDEFRDAGGSNAITLDLSHLWRTVSAFGFSPQAGPAIQAVVEPQ